jgi:hypothetical protein
MSHFSQIACEFKDAECLVSALVATGMFKREQVEVHDRPEHLIDYLGKRTSYRYKDTKDARFKDGDVAHVIVRRQNVGSASNDMGWYLDSKGGSVALIDDYSKSTGKYDQKFVDKVAHEYAISTIQKQAKQKGKVAHRVTTTEGRTKVFVSA